MLALFIGGLGGLESGIIPILILLAVLYGIYRVLLWGKDVIETAAE